MGLPNGPGFFGEQETVLSAGLWPGVCLSHRLCCNLYGACVSAERG